MNTKKSVYVTFAEKKLEEEFELLKEGKYEDKLLYKFIERVIKEVKNNSAFGIKIPKRIWPQVYVQKYSITNLWKYDMPNGWRLLYTIKENDVMIVDVILEWMTHKEYERRFKY